MYLNVLRDTDIIKMDKLTGKVNSMVLNIEKRVYELLSQMTLEEKAAQTCMMRGVEYATKPSPLHICSVESDTDFDEARLAEDFGTDGMGCVHDMYSTPEAFNKIQKYFVEHTRLHIPVIFTGEALHGICGLRGTVFPTPTNLGATFNPELVREVGAAIGRETRALGMHEILSPNLDVAREPRWGRSEETFGEDTYLSCRMAEAIVQGEQKGDISRQDAVIAEPKHYCVHGIPEGGNNCAHARAGRREVESCYLPVFETAIKKGGAYNVMVSYNSVDSDPMMASSYYLKDILKDRMGLKGYTRSDWGGVERLRTQHFLVSTDKDAIEMAVMNGLDVQGCDYSPMFWKQTIVELVNEGRIPMGRLDDICARVLRVKFELGLFDNPYVDEENYKKVVHCAEHIEIARKAAEESLTLLKNDGTLPLKKDISSIALIGPSSNAQQIGGYSSIPQFHVSSVYEELKAAVGDSVEIRQHDGCFIREEGKWEIIEGQPHLRFNDNTVAKENIEEAVEIASGCDVIVAVCGDNIRTSGEGADRWELTLFGRQRELIERLSALGKPLVLVLENGRAIDLSKESEICNAILMTWFGGEMGAKPIVDALLGKVSPAGRLPLSQPRNTLAIPCYYSMLPGGAHAYIEGKRAALYEFGFGLSYTKFEYSDLMVEKLGGYDVRVSLNVKNIGDMDGDEVVQLYIDDVDSTMVTPPCLLKGFERVHIKVGETKRISMNLDFDSFKLMNRAYEWVVEPGRFRILVGASSRDIRLEGEVAF